MGREEKRREGKGREEERREEERRGEKRRDGKRRGEKRRAGTGICRMITQFIFCKSDASG